MAVLEYGFTSKVYPFGTVNGYGAALPTAAPTKMIVTASYSVAPNERIKIRIWNGGLSGGAHAYQTVLDHGKDSAGANTGTYINFLDTELVLGANAPATLADWQTIIKASITCDSDTAANFNASQPVNIYLYYNYSTRLPEVRFEPRDITQTPPGSNPPPNRIPKGNLATSFAGNINVRPPLPRSFSNVPTSHLPNTGYAPLGGVQAQFFAAGTDINFLTTVSDPNGVITGTLPPGSYDVLFYGGGIPPEMFLTGTKALSVGTSDAVSRFGDTASDIAQSADFTSVKNTFASLKWVGYMVVEDFTTGRAQFRNETADATDAFSQSAIYNFGRIYRGLSYIDFIGVGLDPGPI